MKEKSPLAVTAKRWFAADRYLLVRTFSRAKLMAQWMFLGKNGSAEVENEFRVNGKFSIEMREGGEVREYSGAYKEIVPGRKIVFTWHSDSVKNTEVTITFAEKEGGTEFILTHSQIPDEETLKELEQFWTACLNNLEKMTTENK